MAYASTVTISKVQGGAYLVLITETDCATTSEVQITNATVDLPDVGSIVYRTSILTAGTGTTVQPILGLATNPATRAWKYETAAAAASIHDQAEAPIAYVSPNAALYHRSRPNAGTDNSITTVYVIRPGLPG